MPADPVAAIVGKMAERHDGRKLPCSDMYERYAEEFGTNRPMFQQFLIFCKEHRSAAILGTSFSQYPQIGVSNIISCAIVLDDLRCSCPPLSSAGYWATCLGALAAYVRKGFDKVLHAGFRCFMSNIPGFRHGGHSCSFSSV